MGSLVFWCSACAARKRAQPEWGLYCWTISDFFDVLKDQYRQLAFIPINSKQVIDIYSELGQDNDGLIELLQKIYRGHGWPGLCLCRKAEFLAAVQAALQQQYPDFGV